jgi:hypothetical protein
METDQTPTPARNVADNINTTPSPLAVERAFRMARIHGHLWAQFDAQPCYLELGRAIKARQEAAAAYLTCTLQPKEDYEATQAAYQRLAGTNNAYRDATAVANDPDPCPDDEDWPEAKPPANHEEALLLSLAAAHLDLGPCGGIPYAPSADGSINHKTATGRLWWCVTSTGAVLITVRRPHVALMTVILGENGKVHVSQHAPLGTRHLEAVERVLLALGVRNPQLPKADPWVDLDYLEEHERNLLMSERLRIRWARGDKNPDPIVAAAEGDLLLAEIQQRLRS